MSRVDKLQEKYPNVIREVLVKWEATNYGIRDSEALDKVSRWIRATGAYQSRDHDVSLKEIAAKRPGQEKPGFIKNPGYAYMKNGLSFRVKRDSTTPYEIRELDSGQFALFEGEDKVEHLFFPRPKQRAFEEGEEPSTSKGTPVTSLISLRGLCFSVGAVRYCEYFARGEQCKFCNYNATQDDARATGADVPVTLGLQDTVEAYEILSSSVRFLEGRFEMGGIRNSDQEARVHFDFVEKIASGASYMPNLTVHTQPMTRQDMRRLKDSGAACLGFQIEVWDPELFAEICPGKAKYTGFERYKEAFLNAVDVFGAGNVACNFVGGVTMIPPNGHKTWQESRDSLIEGLRWMIKNGVFPSFHSLRLGVGSIYGDDKANRAKLAPTDYYLDAAIAHHEAMMEFGRYPTLNKLMLCPMDCLASFYAGELGMLALAGDIGKWLAGTIPDESNWLAKFISSVKSPAEAE